MYPCVRVSLAKLEQNALTILSLLNTRNISCFLVGKVLAGNKTILSHLANLGFTYLGDSRIQNLKKCHSIDLPKALLRIPMQSEINLLVDWVNLVLVSEFETIRKINQRAKYKAKTIDIILMIDLGDLREGVFYQNDYLEIVASILQLSHVHLKGIGTNLTCYGAIIPDQENMARLVQIKKTIEEHFNLSLLILSGGNSSSLYMLDQLPKEINNLRIGEAIFLGRETAFKKPIPHCHLDAFILEAELVEVKRKPSYPIGTRSVNAFGERPVIEDEGWILRGICAIGKQDVDPTHLTALDEGVRILSASSDHLLVKLDQAIPVGTILRFGLDYGGLLQVMTSSYVHKKIIK